MEEELENSLGISKVDEELIKVKDDLKVFGVTQMKIGKGFEGGIAVVILAIILDRLTQSFGNNKNKKIQKNK